MNKLYMNKRYMIYGSVNSFDNNIKIIKQTDFILVALLFFWISCIKYDGVNLIARK